MFLDAGPFGGAHSSRVEEGGKSPVIDTLALRVAGLLSLSPGAVARTIALLDDQNTIPFIARYRKEVTGGLDEVQIAAVAERAQALRALAARRADVLRLIDEQGKLTDDLARAIAAAGSIQELDDLYLPYRPKRRTRAMVARERGLAPLADLILAQTRGPRAAIAEPFVDAAADVHGVEEALAGARDIVAEIIAEDAAVRGDLRALFAGQATVATSICNAAKDPNQTYAQYYQFGEPLATMPPHRILAMNRGEREGVLSVSVAVPDEQAMAVLVRHHPADDRSALARDLLEATTDSFDRLLAPSLEREMRSHLTARAEAHAIGVFAANLRPLLLQPPLRGRTIIGIDPGFRTGCKVAVVDETGRVLATTAIFPHPPQARRAEAMDALRRLLREHCATVFAVGNGTAGRETEQLVAELIGELGGDLGYMMVDESGASVYSVSALAREEFPDRDATERGAISLARRIQDPLAELVKVEPKAVGVGLYQHDVDQKDLASALERVVESAVNFAGVDVNTASAALLAQVAGLNRKVAAAIVRYREEHGKFHSRAELRKVPGLGPRTFEQAAGFLKIPDSPDLLDQTFIHPESYVACRRLIEWFPTGRDGEGIKERAMRFAAELAARPGDRAVLAAEIGIGEPTLSDMLDNLSRPGRDPRAALPAPIVRTEALSLADLTAGMVLQGTVRNVVDFGAFVDIGLKQAGLVHVSEMADRFVRSPLDVVSVGQRVQVRVISVDSQRGRIGLSMRSVRP